jgi:preprotein translocase subunit SecA
MIVLLEELLDSYNANMISEEESSDHHFQAINKLLSQLQRCAQQHQQPLSNLQRNSSQKKENILAEIKVEFMLLLAMSTAEEMKKQSHSSSPSFSEDRQLNNDNNRSNSNDRQDNNKNNNNNNGERSITTTNTTQCY